MTRSNNFFVLVVCYCLIGVGLCGGGVVDYTYDAVIVTSGRPDGVAIPSRAMILRSKLASDLHETITARYYITTGKLGSGKTILTDGGQTNADEEWDRFDGGFYGENRIPGGRMLYIMCWSYGIAPQFLRIVDDPADVGEFCQQNSISEILVIGDGSGPEGDAIASLDAQNLSYALQPDYANPNSVFQWIVDNSWVRPFTPEEAAIPMDIEVVATFGRIPWGSTPYNDDLRHDGRSSCRHFDPMCFHRALNHSDNQLRRISAGVNNFKQRNAEILACWGGNWLDFTNGETHTIMAIAHGVHPDDIYIDRTSQGSGGNAAACYEMMKSRGYHSAMTTSEPHATYLKRQEEKEGYALDVYVYDMDLDSLPSPFLPIGPVRDDINHIYYTRLGAHKFDLGARKEIKVHGIANVQSGTQFTLENLTTGELFDPVEFVYQEVYSGVKFKTNPAMTEGLYQIVMVNPTGHPGYVREAFSVGNLAPLVDAGPNPSINLPYLALLAGSVADDGFPSGTLTSTWTHVSGPVEAIFGSPNAESTTALLAQIGTYVLELTVSDGSLSASDEVIVTVGSASADNQPPTASAGVDLIWPISKNLTLRGIYSDDGLPTGAITTTWTQESGPGSAVFENEENPQTVVSFTETGAYILKFSVQDGVYVTTDEVSILVQGSWLPPVAYDQTVSTPQDTSITIVLTGMDPNGDSLSFAVVSGPYNGTITGSDELLSYSPYTNFSGVDTFDFTVRDGNGGVDTGTVSITVLSGEDDITKPTVPTNLVGTPIKSDQIDLAWSESTDDVGVTGYKIYRNGSSTPIATTELPSYSDMNLDSATSHSYQVSAYDAAGNESLRSSLIEVTTGAAPYVESFTLSPSSASIEVGQTQQFSSTNGIDQYSDAIAVSATYSVSGGGSINSASGLFTATSQGSFTVTATDGNAVETASIEVTEAPGSDIQVVASATPASGLVPLSVQFNATITGAQSNGGAFIESGGTVVMEAENYSGNDGRADPGGQVWVVDSDVAYSGYAGSGFMATPDDGTPTADWSNACELSYDVLFVTPGTYQIWFRRYVMDGGSNSCYAGINGVRVGGDDNTGPYNSWEWISEWSAVVDAGDHTIQVRRREDGYRLDRIYITKNGDTPSGVGPAESNRSDGVTITWDFGDGVTSTEQNPSHAYTTAGTFTAIVSVDDGTSTDSDSEVISVISGDDDQPPTAIATASPLSGTAPLTVNFDGGGSTDDGTIVSYYWDFGDGSSENGITVNHTYSTPGTFVAVLTVTDDASQSDDSEVLDINVDEAPDLEPPTVSDSLNALAVSSSQIDLSWIASTDNIGVAGYEITRDSVVIDTVSGTTTSYVDSFLAANTTYSYTVEAFDAAGNRSGKSLPASATTLPTPAATIITVGPGKDYSTIQAAVDAVPTTLDDNYEIHVFAGTYFEAVTIAKKTGNFELSINGSTSGVIIDGENSRRHGFNINGISGHIIIENMTIQNVTESGIHCGDSDVTFEINYCTLQNCKKQGIKLFKGSGIIDHCIIKNNGSYGIRKNSGTAQVLSCTIRDNSGLGLSVGAGMLIDGCTIEGNGNRGISGSNADGITLTDNIIRNNVGHAVYLTNGSTNGEITANTIRGGVKLDKSSGEFTIINNMISSSIEAFVDSLGSNTIINNTFLSQSRNAVVLGSANMLVNNIVVTLGSSNSVVEFSNSDLTGILSDHNLYYSQNGSTLIRHDGITYDDVASWNTATGLDGSSLSADPLLVDTTNGTEELHIQAGSPAIDAGDNASAPADDIDKEARPHGTGADIGADEI